MNIYKPTWLYIKQHKITGLKYFGKTIKDPYKYNGSGIVWTNHIRKHGKEHIETIWAKLFESKEELVLYAKNFSIEHNIVESKDWANLCIENGTDGGIRINNNFRTWSKLPKSESLKQKISQKLKGTKNRAEPVSVKGKEFLSMEEAANYFNVTYQTIWLWTKNGKAYKKK